MVPWISSSLGPPTKQVLVAKSPHSGRGNENLHELTLQGGSQQGQGSLRGIPMAFWDLRIPSPCPLLRNLGAT